MDSRPATVFWILSLLSLHQFGGGQHLQASGTAERAGRSVMCSTGRSDLALIENLGQWPCDASFVAVLPNMILRADPESLGMQLLSRAGQQTQGTYLRMVFENTSGNSTLVPEQPGQARHSWFVGSNPDSWVHGAREFRALRWRDLYCGLDIVLHDGCDSVEYDLEVAPGADVEQVRIRYEGQDKLEIDSQGNLVLTTANGLFTQPPPLTYQVGADGEFERIPCRYRLLDGSSFTFEVEGRDPLSALLIDPSLLWSTFFGGAITPNGSFDTAHSVCVDGAGDVYVAGNAAALDFPTTPGAYQFPSGAGQDCFAAKFRGTDGALIYSSVFGGTHRQVPGANNDRCEAITVDKLGRAVAAGWTTSVDFPSTPGSFDPTYASIANAGFVLKLSRNGDQLLWGTFLEGLDSGPFVTDLALDAAGAPVVIGYADAGYPTTPGSFNPIYSANIDGFITKLDPTGSFLLWSTYLGGVGPDHPQSVEVDDQGFVTVAGKTQSIDFPTTPGAFSNTYQGSVGDPNAFVTRLAPQGNTVAWSTFFGGSSGDTVEGMALLPDKGVLICGQTLSQDLPITPGAIGTHSTGGYAARLNPTGSALIYCTYLAGTGIMEGSDVCVDRSGISTIVGITNGGMSMTPGAYDTSFNGSIDVALLRLNPSGTRVYYGTYLGGGSQDDCSAITSTPASRLTVVGSTNSPNYPTTPGSFSQVLQGKDAFITTFDPLLQGVELYGTGTASCHGPLAINATEMPQAGAASFGFYLSGAPSSSHGLCLLSTTASPSGVPYFNATLWVNPATIVRRLAVSTDALGFTETSLPLGSGMTGIELWAQYVMRVAPDCPAGGVTASPALHLTVQ